MNCFMGYNPLATKQVKVTVWVCEQDGATPVAPSNPSAGDCFIVYATDEAVLSNTPTSAKTYADGEWKDAEGGGGSMVIPTVTVDMQTMTYTSAVAFADWVSLINNSPYSIEHEGEIEKQYPVYVVGDGEVNMFDTSAFDSSTQEIFCYSGLWLSEDGTVEIPY